MIIISKLIYLIILALIVVVGWKIVRSLIEFYEERAHLLYIREQEKLRLKAEREEAEQRAINEQLRELQ